MQNKHWSSDDKKKLFKAVQKSVVNNKKIDWAQVSGLIENRTL
jgi:hypothetical protein